MKKYFMGVLTGFAIMFIFGFVSEKNNAPDKEWIIAPRFLKLQDGVTKEEAREWVEKEYLPLYRTYPGWNVTFGEPLRSGGWGTTNNNLIEKADFVLIYSFDTRETAALYFPKDGSASKLFADALTKHLSIVDQTFFGKYFVRDEYQIEEYLMFASSK